MSESREQAVRERAYALWEQDGRPEGRSVAHWSQAEMEIAVEQAKARRSLFTDGTAHRLVGVANPLANFVTIRSFCSIKGHEVERIKVCEVGGKAPR